MAALGTHLVVELKGCRKDLLDDVEFIQRSLQEAAAATGAHIVGQTFHKFSPQGVTGVVAIAESHLAIHTWPEFGYAAVDIFTCGEEFDPYRAATLLFQRLQAQDPTIIELKRGVLGPLGGAPRRREAYVTGKE